MKEILKREDFSYKIKSHNLTIFYKDHPVGGYGKLNKQCKRYNGKDISLLRQCAEYDITQCLAGVQNFVWHNIQKYLEEQK